MPRVSMITSPSEDFSIAQAQSCVEYRFSEYGQKFDPRRFQIGSLEINFSERELVDSSGDVVPFTAAENSVLFCLAINAGRTIGSNVLAAACGRRDDQTQRRFVDATVRRLRRKLAAARVNCVSIVAQRDGAFELQIGPIRAECADVTAEYNPAN